MLKIVYIILRRKISDISLNMIRRSYKFPQGIYVQKLLTVQMIALLRELFFMNISKAEVHSVISYKAYMNEEECDQLYNSQFEPMEFPWLSEVREWVNKTYDTRLLTIALSSGSREGGWKRFLFYFYDQNDKIPRIQLEGGSYREDMSAIDHKIAEVSGLEEGSFDSYIICDFVSQWKRYLTSVKKQNDLDDEIDAFFKDVDLEVRVHHEQCIAKTKEEAGEFLLSEKYKTIKKQIYDLLKTYDKYDLLEEKDIKLFVDYKEHKDSLGYQYGMWAADLMEEQITEYENSLINACYESR